MAKIEEAPIVGEVEGVRVHAKGLKGGTDQLVASHRDREKIRRIADLLQRRGYGVHRETWRMEAREYHSLNALWVGQGDPPRYPVAG
jgi:hypothetical protein